MAMAELDLAIFGDTASVLLGNGDGTFQSPKPFASGINPGVAGNVAMADFNGDGNLDFAFTDLNGSNSGIYFTRQWRWHLSEVR